MEKADKSLECVPFSALSDRQIRAAYHKEGFIGGDDEKLKLVSERAGDMIDFEKGETIVHGVLV